MTRDGVKQVAFENPMLSVDVVVVRYSTTTGLQLGISKRLFAPHLGDLALPGVLMLAGERVAEAGSRAVTSKLGLAPEDVRSIVVGKVFDTPERDVRGPTVSIGCLAVVVPDAAGRGEWVSFDEVPALPFDHNEIVAATRTWFRHLIWENVDVTKALLGEVFSTKDMAALEDALSGAHRNQANVHRKLDQTAFVERTEGPVTGRGRPQTYWRIVTS